MSSATFTTGGTVQAGSGLYIRRRADDDLLRHCLNGDYAYVLAARQVGKSSLMVSVSRDLRERGFRSVIVDLTKVGQSDVDANRWYVGIVSILGRGLSLNTDVVKWWDEHPERSYSDRFTIFLRDVVLPSAPGQMVIFFDEIDTTLGLNFTDDFFAAIRYLYNARSEAPELARLSVVMIGVATPTDLMRDRKRTPFNIGYRIDLDDFNVEETLLLARGLALPEEQTHAVTDWVLKWTGGHPYLTQRLLRALSEDGRTRWTEQDVDSVVERTFFGEQSGKDSNLEHVNARLSEAGIYTYRMLTTYWNVLRRITPVLDNDRSPVKSRLKLSGIVKRIGVGLGVRNEIYERVFSEEWVREQRAIRQERAARRAWVVAAGLGVIALGLAGYASVAANRAKRSALEAQRSAMEATKDRRLSEEATQAKAEADAQRDKAEEAASSLKKVNDDLEDAYAVQIELRKTAEGQKALAEANAKVAQEQSSRAETNAKLASDNAASAARNAQEALDAKIASDKAAKQAAASETTAKEALAESQQKTIQLTGYRLSSDSKLIQATQADPTDEAILLSIEGYKRAPSTDSLQILESGLDRLPRWIRADVKGAIVSLALNNDGSKLAFGIREGTIQTAGLRGQTENAPPIKLPHAPGLLAFSNGRVEGVNDQGETTAGLPPAGAAHPVLALNSTGSAYVTRTSDLKTVDYWSSGQNTPHPLQHHSPVRFATFSGSRLFTLCSDNTVYEWELPALKATRIELPNDAERGVTSFAASSVGFTASSARLFLIAGSSVNVYQVRASFHGLWPFFEREKFVGLRTQTLQHDAPVRTLSTNPGSDFVTTASGSVLRRWSQLSGRELLRVSQATPISAMAVSGDDRWVATAEQSGTVRVWLTEPGPAVAWLNRVSPGSVAFISAARGIAGFGRNEVWNWQWEPDLVSSQPVTGALQGEIKPLFAANGTRLVAVVLDPPPQGQSRLRSSAQQRTNTLRLSDAAGSGAVSVPLNGIAQATAIGPNGQFVAAVVGSQVRAYGSNGTDSSAFNYTPIVRRLAVSADGSKLALVGDSSVQLMGSDGTGPRPAPVPVPVTSIGFSADGRYLVAGSANQISIIDAASLNPVREIRQASASVLVLSPDGKYLAAATGATVRIWEVTTGAQAGVLVISSNPQSLAFSPDSKYLAIGVSNGVGVWVWRPDDLIEEACRRVRVRALSPAEWRNKLGDEPYSETCKL